MLLPTGAKDFREAMQIGSEVYHHLKKVIKAKYGQDAVNVGDEGGFAPNIQSSADCCDLIMEAVKLAGYEDKIVLGTDAAASEFCTKDDDKKEFKYDLNKWVKSGGDEADDAKKDDKEALDSKGLSDFYAGLVDKYPLESVEDSHDEDDWAGWAAFQKQLGDKIQIVGADLAVGLSTGQIKTGAPCRSERLAKYNQLLRIEEDLTAESKAKFAGTTFRKPCESY